MKETLRDLWKKGPIGQYSKNVRIDPNQQKEPEADNEYSRKLWLEDVYEDPDFENEVKEELKNYQKLVSQTSNPDKLKVFLIGQSHIDVAWKWRYEQTRQKGIVTVKKALLHANRFPGQFKFALSEPLLLQWIIEDQPTLFEELKKGVETGAIELVGGSYVEPDCMMPSGEAFIRQRLYGQRFYYQHFGRLATVEWFLDSFGYNYGLPQILVKSGAKYFWTSKITWNRQTIFPFVDFWWQGPDGTKILTANFQQGWAPLSQWIRFEIGRHPLKPNGKQLWDYRDDYENLCDEIDDNPENVIPPVGIFFGKGDGGHGPTHQEVTFAQMAAKTGWVQWGTSEEYFKALEAYGDKLPIWNDELYLEYHRGTFSIHYEVKRHNRLFERKLVAVESLASLLAIANKSYKYPFDKLESIWKIVLLNHFHDVLPGSSIPEVYDDVFLLWKECNAGIDEMLKDWAQKITAPKGTQITFSNPLSWDRVSPVFIPINDIKEKVTLDSEGKPPYIQLIQTDNVKQVVIGQPIAAEKGDKDDTHPAGWWTIVKLPSLATKCFSVQILKEKPKEVVSNQATATKFSNGLVTLEISPKTGAITHLSMKGLNAEKNLMKGDQSNLTVGFLDDVKSDHAWNIRGDVGTPYWTVPLVIPNDKNVKVKIIENGPIFISAEITKTLGEGAIKDILAANEPIGANYIVQKITLFKDIPEVYLSYETDWQQPWVMLKINYDTATEANTTVSDQAYCAITRSTQPKSRPDQARFEKIMHTYADLSTPDNSWGITLLNEGKYAYDATGGNMRLTLLRTATYTDPAGEAWVNMERKQRKEKDGSEVPKYIDLGYFRCRYALFPHVGGALQSKTSTPLSSVKRSAEEFNNPIIVQKVEKCAEGSSVFVDGTPLITCEPSHVLVSSVKQKEWEPSQNMILRVVEVSGFDASVVKVKICPEIAKRIKKVNAVDLIECPVSQDMKWNAITGEISFKIGKFEICSFELVF